MRVHVMLAGLLLALAGAGCGGDGRGEAIEVADRWLQAVGERDAEGACELMRPSAVEAIRIKYTRLPENADCRLVVRTYADAFAPDAIATAREDGLEVARGVKNDEIGVFPAAPDYDTQVVLMRRAGDEWLVASTSIAP